MAGSNPTPPPLGVGALVDDTVSLYLKRIHCFAGLAVVPLVITGLIMVSVFGSGALTGEFNADAGTGSVPSAVWRAAAIGMPLYTVAAAISMAMITSATHDARAGRPVRLGFYVTNTFRHAVPLFSCALIVAILVYAGLFLLVVPGLLMLGVFFVVVPVIVIEGRGFRSLGRGAGLGKGYRWPIMGYILVLTACAAIINAVTGWIITPLFGLVGDLPGAILSAVVTATTTSFFYLGPALLHARLIEIKEGGQPKQVGGVVE